MTADAPAQITLYPHGELTAFFGRARSVQLAITPGTTIRGLLQQLGVPPGEVWVSARNGVLADPEDVLAPGDRLEIFSPVAGGSWPAHGGSWRRAAAAPQRKTGQGG